MLSDGELARLTKEDFIELIRTPVLRGESLQESRERVNSGALWLDVRFPEEHTADGLTDSLNIPLSSLRASHGDLNKDLPYVVYCDTGGRSSAAAFLLTQEGFEVSYVVGGAIDEVATNKIADSQSIPEQARVEPAPLKKTQ
jgi:rhodanese-related sulfurtransferase